MSKSYDHKIAEPKWQKKWREEGIYEPDLKTSKKPFFNLMMFPYPSAEGLHVGNMYAFTGADIYGRFKRMQGMDVFEPIGLDGFGIHSENYAIKAGIHPKKHAKDSEKNYYRQLSEIGNGFSWNSKLETYDPDYYRWTQWIFLQMYKNGLAYKGTAYVNWCPSCKTVLADEQVENSKCERCKNEVTRREMTSWYFKITDYADRLLENIEKIDWPKKIKIAQRQWIGRKEGINITYNIKGSEDKVVCFTTRPDTNFGATFVVLGPEHELAQEWAKTDKKVKKYVENSLNKSDIERLAEGKKKTGVFTGLYAINDLTGYEMPIYVADFVLGSVGTGAVVGVPGHDVRDFEFAKEFDLKVIRVVVASDGDDSPIAKVEQVQEEEGTMINSDFLDGLDINEATKKITKFLEEKEQGERVVDFRLRDWLISRQRYWGPPIPMINCNDCGWQPVPEKDLPVELPDIKDFKPKGDGTSPLSNAPESWRKVDCPKCGKAAERELDVSDTFLDSSWYFLAYPNLATNQWKKGESPLNKEITKRWLPVDTYIGGAEHAVLHLLYARFVTMAMKDWEMIDFEEPFPFLFSHGLIIKDGKKMSKSRGNVVNPDDYIKKYGADTLRTYLMFLGPYDKGGDFKDSGIEGMGRFLKRIWVLYEKSPSKDSRVLLTKLHQTIKKVTKDVEEFKYNTAIASLMELTNLMQEEKNYSKDTLVVLTQMIAPFMPHMTEELWVKLKQKGSVHTSKWPGFKKSLAEEKEITIAVQVNGKLRSTLRLEKSELEDEKKVIELAKGDEKVKKWLENKKIKKEIYIPGKIVNFVT